MLKLFSEQNDKLIAERIVTFYTDSNIFNETVLESLRCKLRKHINKSKVQNVLWKPSVKLFIIQEFVELREAVRKKTA